MSGEYAGEIAALGTALCWSFSSVFFTIGGRRVGSVMVNRARLVAAVLLVSTAHLLLLGSPFPLELGRERLWWFGLSALFGLVLGDSLLFQAYLMVGARIGMLLLSLNPIFGAVFAWAILGETLRPIEVLAMLVAVGGAAWVVAERGGNGSVGQVDRRKYTLGAAMALGAGMCQALGIILAKRGLADSFSPLSAVVVRMTVAMVVMWFLAAVRGEVGTTVRTLRCDRRAELAILAGATAGPFLGVWLSMIAVQGQRVGIASTLMGMSPIFMLPLVRFLYHETVSPRAIAGTVLAVAGVAAIVFV